MDEALLGVGACLAILLAAVFALIVEGLRAGDCRGDALVLEVEPQTAPRAARVTLINPGVVPVIVGMSLRRAGLRLGLEGDGYVRIRTRSTSPDVLAACHSTVGVLDAGETATFVVSADAHVGRRAELVAAIGQRDRLRTIHRLVRLSADASRRSAGGREPRRSRRRERSGAEKRPVRSWSAAGLPGSPKA